jgi:hypothetical protein
MCKPTSHGNILTVKLVLLNGYDTDITKIVPMSEGVFKTGPSRDIDGGQGEGGRGRLGGALARKAKRGVKAERGRRLKAGLAAEAKPSPGSVLPHPVAGYTVSQTRSLHFH